MLVAWQRREIDRVRSPPSLLAAPPWRPPRGLDTTLALLFPPLVLVRDGGGGEGDGGGDDDGGGEGSRWCLCAGGCAKVNTYRESRESGRTISGDERRKGTWGKGGSRISRVEGQEEDECLEGHTPVVRKYIGALASTVRVEPFHEDRSNEIGTHRISIPEQLGRVRDGCIQIDCSVSPRS